jgi:hypothetical protein
MKYADNFIFLDTEKLFTGACKNNVDRKKITYTCL